MNRKPSFLLYFDNIALLERLSLEDAGGVVLAVAEFARRVSDGEAVTTEKVLESRAPSLSPAAQMVYFCMADNAARDARKWLSRQAACQEAALRRQDSIRALKEYTPAAPSSAPVDKTKDDKAKDDIEFLRRYVGHQARDTEKKPSSASAPSSRGLNPYPFEQKR